MTTKSDDPDSPLGELAHLYAVLASIEGAMHDLHPQLVVPENQGRWGDVLREWNATQLAKMVEPEESVRQWLARWRAGEEAREALLKPHNEKLALIDGLLHWAYEPASFKLVRSQGPCAATVYTNGTWHTWDLLGIGGENAEEPTVDQAMTATLAAVLRQSFDQCPEPCEACDGTGYQHEGYEDPHVATLQAQVSKLGAENHTLQKIVQHRSALALSLSGKLSPTAICDAMRLAAENGAWPLDCSIVQLRHALTQLQTRLTAMHGEVPRYPTLGSMGGGSVRETELQERWGREVGVWGKTFQRLQDAIEGGLRLTAEALQAETERPQLCVACGQPVEEPRRCYAIPHCYACLPRPPLLPVASPRAGNAPTCPKCGCANFEIRKRCRDCGEDLVMHPDPAIDAEIRWDAEDARRSDGEAFAASLPVKVTRRTPESDDRTKIGPRPHPFGDGNPLDVAVAQSELGALLDKYADGHSGAARMNILAHFGASVLRASGNGAAIDDAAADAAHESMRRVDPLAELHPDERPKSPGESYIKVSTKGPFLECEWSPFSTCHTPKNWGAYGGSGEDGWYCALSIVNGFADMGIKATGEGDSQAAAELDAMCKVFRTLVEYVADTNDEERARLLAISIIARRMREAVPK